VQSGAQENTLAQSESTVRSSRGAREHLEVLRSTGVGYQRVWEVLVWLPDRFTYCQYIEHPRAITVAQIDNTESEYGHEENYLLLQKRFYFNYLICSIESVQQDYSILAN
jgi:hypothetical protein